MHLQCYGSAVSLEFLPLVSCLDVWHPMVHVKVSPSIAVCGQIQAKLPEKVSSEYIIKNSGKEHRRIPFHALKLNAGFPFVFCTKEINLDLL